MMSRGFMIALGIVLLLIDTYAYATAVEIHQEGVTQNSTIALVGIICNLIATCFVGWVANRGHDAAVESGKTAQLAVVKATEASDQSRAASEASAQTSINLQNHVPHILEAIKALQNKTEHLPGRVSDPSAKGTLNP